ncbi:MAG: SDR family oxidoreductase [Acidimicrobiales bacterium]|nr:SDR family oxidoreductase [Acidimicrobiales bacterium]
MVDIALEGRPARHVVISGASSGIGQATAERFARSGDRVTNIDSMRPLQPFPGVYWLPGDVSDWPAMGPLLDDAGSIHGPIDVVVANAGISIRHSVLDCTEPDFRRVLDVNVLGVFALWREAAIRMLGGSGGVLLATASTNGVVGYPYYADYNASKAAVLSFCKTFALELAPVIRTGAVSPGYVMTPMQEAEYTEAMIDDLNRRIPLGRHTTPAEVAEAFYYLASPGASYLTGQALILDGGELAGGTASGHGTSLVTPVQPHAFVSRRDHDL